MRPRGALGLVVAAVIALLHGCGGTPIQTPTTTPVNNITLHQTFEVAACEPTSGDDAGVSSPATTGATPARAAPAPRRTAATDQVAAANGCSVAISNDLWIAGTTAQAEPSTTGNITPTTVHTTATVPINAGPPGAPGMGAGAPSTPAAPASPAAPE